MVAEATVKDLLVISMQNGMKVMTFGILSIIPK
jgi:hypothetical protein